jgi:hypothetical protein
VDVISGLDAGSGEEKTQKLFMAIRESHVREKVNSGAQKL